MYSFKDYNGMQYCEYLPEDFDQNKKYPVIFFLHGAIATYGIIIRYNDYSFPIDKLVLIHHTGEVLPRSP